ncbi:MAG: LegC family aminotransferase [Gammaproteobacteria bacterium]|jgi:perosamine synthetase|nr:LegC family aminotransferase [Gammaproteobacteria bacterium]
MDSLDIVKTILASINKQKPVVALHEPIFNGHEWDYVKDCLDTGWVSSVGQYVNRFEQALQDYTGVNHAVAVVNGTAALHVCLELSGVQQNDEVLLPALTFVATANAVSYCGATPHFVDVAPLTLGVDAERLEAYLDEHTLLKNGKCFNKQTQRRIRALIAVHTFGHPVDLSPLLALCKDYGITLIEDAAESLGSLYKGQHTGNFGVINALSFNGNKIITSGGGGAILTNDHALAKNARHITSTAKLPHAWEFVHDQVAYNYRMPNLNAALGLSQLEQIDVFLERKRALANTYLTNFKDAQGIHLFKEPDYARSNYWLNVLTLDNASIKHRDAVLETCHDHGIQARPVWRLLHKLPMYRQAPRMPLPVSEHIEASAICLPSSVNLWPG